MQTGQQYPEDFPGLYMKTSLYVFPPSGQCLSPSGTVFSKMLAHWQIPPSPEKIWIQLDKWPQQEAIWHVVLNANQNISELTANTKSSSQSFLRLGGKGMFSVGSVCNVRVNYKTSYLQIFFKTPSTSKWSLFQSSHWKKKINFKDITCLHWNLVGPSGLGVGH